jgi:divinyl protochlorophyllide a 8-vinyl-reductase
VSGEATMTAFVYNTGKGDTSPELDIARIGPNAILRVGDALAALHDETTRARIFARAGLSHYLSHPPGHMVDEREVARLHHVLADDLGERSRSVARDAGHRTGDYLLANRIPKGAQRILKLLPAPVAARILVNAIGRHAWTFCGSGSFSAVFGQPLVLTIRDNPVARGVCADAPACDYFAATFERIFRVLVSPRTRVTEIECLAAGGTACRFAVDWSRG